MDNKTVVIRLLVAFLLGAVLGMEREATNKPAGIKTHIMVALGSALTMLFGIYISEQYSSEHIDPTRIAAQVISGIGFLGALCVLKDKSTIVGLTTASSIWVMACIGLAVGGGFILGAIVVTILILINLMLIPRVERKFKTYFNKKEENED